MSSRRVRALVATFGAAVGLSLLVARTSSSRGATPAPSPVTISNEQAGDVAGEVRSRVVPTAALREPDAFPTAPVEARPARPATSDESELLALAREAIRNRTIREFPVTEIPWVIDDMLSEQAKDAEWTNQVLDALNRLPRLVLDDTARISDAQCYVTMCKIVTTHASREDAGAFWDDALAVAELTGPGQRFTERVDEHTVKSVQYLARHGDDLKVHDAVFNRLYEIMTFQKKEDIIPSAKDLAELRQELAESLP